MPFAADSVVRFGSFEVDLSLGELRKHRVRLRIFDQSFEVLRMLLEQSGKVVTRGDLRQRLWPKDVFVDFESNLNTAVARLREALCDSADHPRFIETLPKRGYRFIGALSPAVVRRPRLLVLPFANLSGDPAQEYFSDAVTEEIIGRLACLAPEQLAVVARTSAMHYKGSQKGIAQIGRELNLDYVVEGSVRRMDDRITATVQLIQVSDQTHLWNQRYEVGPSELFKMESSSAQEIAARLGIASQRTPGKPTEKPEA